MKKLLSIVLLSALSIVGRAETEEVLWWMVDGSESVDWYGQNITVNQLSASKENLYARMSVRDSSGQVKDYLPFYQFDNDHVVFPSEGEPKIDVWAVQDVGIEPFAVLVPYNTAEYSFAIELGNFEDGQWISYVVSEVRGYNSLYDEHIATWAPGHDPILKLPWQSVFFVPEPCSGLLLLVGGGLLALRRRRRV